MTKIVPREKMSKSQRRKLDLQKRSGWGGLNPVTRRPPNPKAYNRKKIQKGMGEDTLRFESFSFDRIAEQGFMRLKVLLPTLFRESRPIPSSRLSEWGV